MVCDNERRNEKRAVGLSLLLLALEEGKKDGRKDTDDWPSSRTRIIVYYFSKEEEIEEEMEEEERR